MIQEHYDFGDIKKQDPPRRSDDVELNDWPCAESRVYQPCVTCQEVRI